MYERIRVDSPHLGTRDAWVATVAVPGAQATVRPWVRCEVSGCLIAACDRGCVKYRREMPRLGLGSAHYVARMSPSPREADRLRDLFVLAYRRESSRLSVVRAAIRRTMARGPSRVAYDSQAATPRLLFATLYPAAHDGGGERQFFNAVLSAQRAGQTVDIACIDQVRGGELSPTEQRGVRFLFATGADDHRAVTTVMLGDLLARLARYDAVVVCQYLGNSLTLEIARLMNAEQNLYLMNLGFEPWATEFWSRYQPAANHAIVEISRYSASRVPKQTTSARAVSAAVWAADVGVQTMPAAALPLQLCAIGRVLPHKGFETVIRATPANSRAVIVGESVHDPEYLRYLEALAGPNVAFAGHVSTAEKSRLLHASQCLVAASTHRLYDGRLIPQPELLGLVLFEAVTHGCLPVASRIPAFIEVMTALGLEEFLFPENDAAAARVLVERVFSLGAADRGERLAKAAAEIRRTFLWDDYWERVTGSSSI